MREDEYFRASNDTSGRRQSFDFGSSLLIDKSKGFVSFKNEHYVKFRWRPYFRFMFYHIAYIFLLGPLFPLFFAPFIGMNMCRNLSFTGYGVVQFTQWVLWLTATSTYVIYFFFPEWNHANHLISSTDVYAIWTLTLLRISNISSKYATFTLEKLAYMSEHLFTQDERMWDLLFGPWMKQSDEKVLDELGAAIKRNEVEFNLMMVYFLTPPDDVTYERLLEKSERFKSRSATLIGKYGRSPLNSKSALEDIGIACKNEAGGDQVIFGVALLHDLIEKYRTLISLQKKQLFCLVLGIFRSCIPFITYRHQQETIIWWVVTMLVTLQNVGLYSQNVAFLLLPETDMRRKIFIEQQLAYIITPKKYGGAEGEKKMYPTNNFLCPKNLRGWNLLRKISRDYGYRYSLRESNNLAAATALYLSMAVLLGLHFFHVIKLTYINETDSITFTIAFDVVVFFVLVVKQLLLGIGLNKFYQIHKNNFEEMQIFIADIARKMEWYFVKNIKPKNYLYNYIITYFKTRFDTSDQLANTSERLEDILGTLREINRDLDYEEANKPFCILGFEPTYRLLSTIGVGISSLLFAIVQFYLKERASSQE